jgi:predicted secreted protein
LNLISGLAVFFIIWWVVLFAVLPWGARSAHEADEQVDAGHAASAPLKPMLARKFAVTTLIAVVVFASFYLVSTSGLITLDDIPFLPRFEPY